MLLKRKAEKIRGRWALLALCSVTFINLFFWCLESSPKSCTQYAHTLPPSNASQPQPSQQGFDTSSLDVLVLFMWWCRHKTIEPNWTVQATAEQEEVPPGIDVDAAPLLLAIILLFLCTPLQNLLGETCKFRISLSYLRCTSQTNGIPRRGL